MKNVCSKYFSVASVSLGSLSENNISETQIEGFSSKLLKKEIPYPRTDSVKFTIEWSNSKLKLL